MQPTDASRLPPNEQRGRFPDVRALRRMLLSPEQAAEAERLEAQESDQVCATLGAEITAAERDRDARLPALDKARDDASAKLNAARVQLAAAERAHVLAEQARSQFLTEIESRISQPRSELERRNGPFVNGAWTKLQAIDKRIRTPREGDEAAMFLPWRPDVIARVQASERARQGLKRLEGSSLPAAQIPPAIARIFDQLERELGTIDAAMRERQARADEARRPGIFRFT